MTISLDRSTSDLLDKLRDPISGHLLSSSKILDFVEVRDQKIRIILCVDQQRIEEYENLKDIWENALTSSPNISSAEIGFTASRKSSSGTTADGETDPKSLPQAEGSVRKRKSRRPPPPPLPKPAKTLIAVSSAKGGVGKSTVAVNLTLALARKGIKCGLLDADIYGPSVPKMLGIKGNPSQEDGKLIPVEAHDIRVMSMGFFMQESTPVIWRGPMVMSAVEQMLRDVAWDGTDVIVIDLPPGTGDAQLTLVQRVKLDAALIVTTPQEIALIDVRKGMEMFRKVDVPILGIVENMTYFICDSCQKRHYPFGKGKTEAVAQQFDSEILIQIPIIPKLNEDADEGVPPDAESEAGKLFDQLADIVHEDVIMASNR